MMPQEIMSVAAKIQRSDYDALTEYCEANGATISNVIRLALRDWLHQRGVKAEFAVGAWGGEREGSGSTYNKEAT